MASSIDICNRALIRLGAKTIMSLTEDSKEARLCNILYDQIRKDILRSHPWNFAMKRTTLAADADLEPGFQYSYYVPLPSDCLRLWQIYDTQQTYKVEGRYIACDLEEVEAIYIADIEDTEQFDSLFVTLFVLRLGVELGYNLAGSASIVQLLDAEFRQLRREARLFDGQEGIPDSFDDGWWLMNRY